MEPFRGATDERIRRTVFPVRVVQTFGQVENVSSLLKEKPLQITTGEPDCALLKNTGNGPRAGVVLDFGRELHGCVRLLGFTGTGASVRVRITCGESVAEATGTLGVKNATNDHAARDWEAVVPLYSDQTFQETGFRFVCLRLMDENADLLLKSIAAVAVYRDIPYLGSFRCSSELLNRIYDTAAYTCHLNMQNYVWDGIKRDRLVWAGDMHPEMLTIRTVFGPQKVYEDSLRFLRDTMPLPGWMHGMPTYSLWWLIQLRDWYLYTGNIALVEESREYVTGLTEQILPTVHADGSDTFPGYFLDWPSREKPQEKAGSRALLVLALDAAAQLMQLYGQEESARLCQEKASAMRSHPQTAYGAKQAAAMLSLAGWADPHQMASIILEGGATGWSTFMSYYLLKAASVKDMAGTLHILEAYYGAMLKLGATTFWEDFQIEWLENAAPIDAPVPPGKRDVHGDNGAFCYVGLRHSLCHGWSSGPTAFLAEEVLGIHILSPGCKKMAVAPNLGDLEWAEGTYPTPLGILTVSCRRQADGSVSVDWTAPEGMEVVPVPEHNNLVRLQKT